MFRISWLQARRFSGSGTRRPREPGVADLSRDLAGSAAIRGKVGRGVFKIVPKPQHLPAAERELYQTREGRYRSGQTGQTVNLLALRLRWFESSPAHFLTLG